MIEDFPRTEVDRGFREDLACPDDLPCFGGGRVGGGES
jgi:hypothetical protein